MEHLFNRDAWGDEMEEKTSASKEKEPKWPGVGQHRVLNL